ncbi:magnesium transporter NIPA-domain-containing protein [Mycotypha africana]|uniref:magnesium transporter NIPA-domain-containing protein n=1 Tax=Mycotypha africana TaxID=64632 RepID=UPI0023004C19|nr:magnesium transporter NIPA-domain-containing protein [Mycotypha africana]KAI8979484.1 magnesium transporter NIPA-domain-containing protein [Mycotypha africana]
MNNYKLSDTEDSKALSTLIGVLISAGGNVLISFALNVQKRAHNNIQEKQQYYPKIDNQPQWIASYNDFLPDDGYSSPRNSFETHPSSFAEGNSERQQKFSMPFSREEQKATNSEYLKSRLWWLGILLMVLGEAGNFIAYGFAPASTIAPLGTTTLVANVIIAPVMLKEVFRRRDLLGVILAVSGAAIVVLSSKAEEVSLSPELIMQSIRQSQSIVYFVFSIIVLIILTILSPVYGSSSIFIDLGLVAVYGGYTVLSTKSVASLLSLTFWKMFTFPVSYFLIFILIVTAILQIKYLNKALQQFDSTEVIPTQFVLFTISAILGSAVLYHDFDNMEFDQLLQFMLGCIIEFLGVYLITSKRAKYNTHDMSEEAVHADSGACISLNDDTDEVISYCEHSEILPNDQSSILSATSQLQVNDYKSLNRKRSSVQVLTASAVQPVLRNSSSFEIWRDSPESKSHIPNSNTTPSHSGHRRNSSSIFRGISMASQLVDRNEETTESIIQLPISSSPTIIPNYLINFNKLNDKTLNNILQGFATTFSSVSTSQDRRSSLLPQHNDTNETAKINLSVCTSATPIQQNKNRAVMDEASDRELMPIHNLNTSSVNGNNKLPRSRKLIDIEEDMTEDETTTII